MEAAANPKPGGDGSQFPFRQEVGLQALRVTHRVPTVGHLTAENTWQCLTLRFYWPGIREQVRWYCAACPECQRTQPKGPLGGGLIPLPIIGVQFERMGIDLVRPLPPAQGGYTHILVLVDYTTRYPEAVPLQRTGATAIARGLIRMFSWVGFPKEVITDQGTNFMSRVLRELWKLLKVQPLRTSIYHPQTNGLVE